MPLDFSLVDVKFVQGMDTKTNKKLVVPGKWNLLENCSLSTDYTLTKRPGVVRVPSALYPSTTQQVYGNGLGVFNDQLLTVNKERLATTDLPSGTSYPSSDLLGWVGIEKNGVYHTNNVAQDGVDVAVLNLPAPVQAYVWRNVTAAGVPVSLNVCLQDMNTGANKIPITVFKTPGGGPSDLMAPRIVAGEDFFYIFYIDNGNLYGRLLYLDSGTVWLLGAETTLVGGGVIPSKNFDACAFNDSLGGEGSAGVSFAITDATYSVRAVRVDWVAGTAPSVTDTTNILTNAQLALASVTGIGVCQMYSTGVPTYYATFVAGTGATAMSGTSVVILKNDFTAVTTPVLVDGTVGNTTAPTHVAACGDKGIPEAVVFTDEQSSYGLNVGATGVLPLRRSVISTNGTIVTVVSSTDFVNSAYGPSAGTNKAQYPQGPFICGKPFGSVWEYGSGTFGTNTLFLPVCILEKYTIPATNPYTMNAQNSWFLLDGKTGEVVAKALYGSYGIVASAGSAPAVCPPCSTPLLSYTDLETNRIKEFHLMGVAEAAITSIAGSVASNSPSSSDRLVDLTLTGIASLSMTTGATASGLLYSQDVPVPAPKNVQLGTSQYFAGGALSTYDGTFVTEAGFNLFPEGISLESVGGGAMTAGVHSVVAVYEWVDGAGQRHQSAPSLPVSTSSAVNDKLQVRVPTLMLQQKTGMTLVLYVTQAGGTTFNRATLVTDPKLNVTTSAWIVIEMTMADTALINNELLYHQPFQAGSTLSNVSPGPCSMTAVHQNRLFIDQTDQKGVFQYSQQVVNQLGLQWNPALRGTIPRDGGNITGFASLDDKLIVLCERKLYWVGGSGPGSSGANNNYGEPTEIPSDTGCTYPKSVIKTPKGIMFKGPRGFYLLGRDLQVTDVGDGVKAWDYQNVTAAQYVGDDQQEIRFHTDTVQLDGLGVPQSAQLIYSYILEQWSTYQVQCQYLPPDFINPVDWKLPVIDAIWWPTMQGYYYISDIGFQKDVPGYQVDSPHNTDSSLFMATFFAMKCRTAFLHLPALEGYQRVRWLYLTSSATTTIAGHLTIAVDYDDVYQAVTPTGAPGAYATSYNLTANAATFNPDPTVLDVRHKLHRQKCKSVAFTFSEIPHINAISGLPDQETGLTGFQALVLEVGIKRGTSKLPAAKAVP